MFHYVRPTILAITALAVAFATAGCGQNTPSDAASNPAAKSSATASADHSGWWCNEHGVPEAECSMCSSKAAAQFKAKGDWCEEHNRAESQCFICSPARAEKYAALYEAKFGTRPPERQDER